jgi:hypothetical protein
VVQTVLDDTRLKKQDGTLAHSPVSPWLLVWYLFLVRLLSIGVLRSSLLETSLLLLLGLRTVLVSKLEELSGSVLVEGIRELGDRGRDFQALVENDFLTLEANVLGPFDEAGQVLLGLDILTWILKGQSSFRLAGGASKGKWDSDRRYPPIPKFLGVASKSGF